MGNEDYIHLAWLLFGLKPILELSHDLLKEPQKDFRSHKTDHSVSSLKLPGSKRRRITLSTQHNTTQQIRINNREIWTSSGITSDFNALLFANPLLLEFVGVDAPPTTL